MIVAYYSLTGNTKTFVDKLGVESVCIDKNVKVDTDYILITPTYSGGRPPKPVIDFLGHRQNRKHLRGVIGAGNRNFFADFGAAANSISDKLGVPLLYKFEITGNEKDVNNIRRGLNEW